MLFLIAIPTHYLTYVTCRSIWTTLVLILFFLLIHLCCVDSGSGGGAFLLSVSATLSVFLLFVLVGLLRGLSLMLRSWCFGLLGFGSRFLRSRVSYRVSLGASSSGVELVVAQTLLIYLFDVGGGLQACLGLSINRFLYDLGLTV